MTLKIKASGRVTPPSGEIWSKQGYAAKVFRGREALVDWWIEDNVLYFTAKKLYSTDMTTKDIMAGLMIQFEDAEWDWEFIRCC